MIQQQDITVTKNSWTLVAEDYSYVLVQLKGVGALLVYFCQSGEGPPAAQSHEGVAVNGDGAYVSLGSLPAGAQVWVRSNRDASETITVVSY